MKSIKARLFKTCPRSGRIIGLQPLETLSAWLLPLAGLAALLWVVIRVVPKPSRANYPCQRVAMPMAAAFLASVVGAAALPRLRRHLRIWTIASARFRAGLGILFVFLLLGLQAGGTPPPASAAYPAHAPNVPIGEAQGLAPGRVVWVHDPDVTDWAGSGSGTRWYDHVDPAVAADMLSWALRAYTGQAQNADAWDAIFAEFNGGTGYTSGEKIVIKINLVTSSSDPNGTSSIYNTPQLLVALLDQLVNQVGVAQADITVTDPTGTLVNFLFTPMDSAFPDVRYENNTASTGRVRAAYTSPCVPYYWSTTDANGKTQDCVVQSYYQADYLINFALLKTHDRAGITVTAKNHYGSMLRTPVASGYYDVHGRLPLQPANTAWRNMGYYRPLVDLMGNEYIGGKTMLFLVDGIFGGKNWNAVPSMWSMVPFNNDWPSSLFLSMDPVAIDSVAFDFLSQKWPEHALAYEGVQDYLHEAAQADDPTSGTCYDPERDSICLDSLGVHEHWNNATDKQYTRNLGTGDGIELLYVDSDPGTGDYTLSITSAHGTVTKNPDQATYDEGDIVQLTAYPDTGWSFSSWSGDVISLDNPISVTIHSNFSVTANYTRNCYLLILSHTGNGINPVASPTNSAGCSSGYYHYGEVISLSGAAADTGWYISSWTGTSNDTSTASTNNLSMPAAATTAAVNYLLTMDHRVYLPFLSR